MESLFFMKVPEVRAQDIKATDKKECFSLSTQLRVFFSFYLFVFVFEV